MLKKVQLRNGDQKLEFIRRMRDLTSQKEQWFRTDGSLVTDLELTERLDNISHTGVHVIVEGEKYVVDSYGLG